GDVERPAVGAEADVLRHGRGPEGEPAQRSEGLGVELQQIAGELAAGDEVAAVGGEVGVVDAPAGHVDRAPQRHGVRVAYVEPVAAFRHDEGRPAVRGEVQVVRRVDRYRSAGLPGARVDRYELVAAAG